MPSVPKIIFEPMPGTGGGETISPAVLVGFATAVGVGRLVGTLVGRPEGIGLDVKDGLEVCVCVAGVWMACSGGAHVDDRMHTDKAKVVKVFIFRLRI